MKRPVESCRAVLACGILNLVLFPFCNLHAGDWPRWGGQAECNMVSETEKGLPDWYSPGEKKPNGDIDPATSKNVKWAVKLAPKTYSSPVVSQGRLFIGVAGTKHDEAAVLCFDTATGILVGRFVCGTSHVKPDNFGVCSTPDVDGDRLFFVAPFPEVFCLDVSAWLKAKPVEGAAPVAPAIVWRHDMARTFQIKQDHVASCSPLIVGDYVYVCTGNGRYKNTKWPFHPLTPSLVAFDKRTGQLVARDDEQIGERLWRGQWSSPSLATVNGKAQILFATGNGFCYAFEPVDPAVKVVPDRTIEETLRPPIVYFIDVENKNTGGLPPADYAKANHIPPEGVKPALPLEFRYSIRMPITTPITSIPTAKLPDVPVLKKMWWFDCLPTEYRHAPFYAQGGKGDGKIHPADIIATPVFYRNRVYIAIGGDPQHGSKNSQGHLVCIDATKTGDISHGGEVWHCDDLNATYNTVAATHGLIFAIDERSTVHCLDADTGKKYWNYTLPGDRDLMNSALLVADGKVFAGKSVLAADKTLKVLCTVDKTAYGGSSSTPCAANGVVYAVMGTRLLAICDKGDKQPAAAGGTTGK